MRLLSFIVLMLTLLACYFAYITGVAKLVEAGSVKLITGLRKALSNV